jgi:fucose 4-O-acetylase-like acetyltransferase
MKRELYIDWVKGLSILCIVLLHFEDGTIPRSLNIFIGQFMVTAFYVTAGWVTAMNPAKLSTKEFLHKRWRQLGVPYLYWSLILLCFDLILWGLGYYDSYFIGREVYKTLVLRGIGTLWFLPALFIGSLIWHTLQEKSKWIIILAFLLSVAYMLLYGSMSYLRNESTLMKIVDAPFRTIANFTNAWIGVAFGFYSYKFSKNLLKKGTLLFCLGGIILIISYYLRLHNCPHYLEKVQWLITPLWAPLGFLYIGRSLHRFQQFPLLRYLQFWGLNSLNLMVTHYSITLVLFTILVENVLGIPFHGWITLAAFLLALPIQHIWVIVIDKYAKKTLGK